VEFQILFYKKKKEKTGELINHILSYPISLTGEFRKAKYIFYKAYLLFCKEEFKDSLKLLLTPLEVEKDKCEWNIVLRILTIQVLIELDKREEASRASEALRKHLERNKNDKKIKERDKLIVKCLRELEKHNFEYRAEDKTVAKIIKQLAAKNTDVSWKYFSPELIPFHEWAAGKFKV
jgi:hypothetical protein